MSAGLHVRADVPERGLAADLTVPGGSVTALVGPNGAGKSTLVQVVAGIVLPARGEVRVGERVLTAEPGGVHVPPHRRGVAALLQDPALFPRMSALHNVVFALRSAGVPRAAARGRALALLADLDVDHLAGRLPHELSGGQRARVAVARALAPDPRVVVLDEPFAAVDAAAADEVRTVVGRALAGRTTLLVTHHAADVRALATHVAVLEGGVVTRFTTADVALAGSGDGFLGRLLDAR